MKTISVGLALFCMLMAGCGEGGVETRELNSMLMERANVLYQSFQHGEYVYRTRISILGDKDVEVLILETGRGADYGFIVIPKELNPPEQLYWLQRGRFTIFEYRDNVYFCELKERYAQNLNRSFKEPQ